MIRRPLTLDDQRKWWRDAVNGLAAPIDPDLPEVGYYETALVQGGVLVPVEIALHQEIDEDTGELADDTFFYGSIGGEYATEPQITDIWTWCARYPIPRNKFRHMIDKIKYAKVYEPWTPEADPFQPVDLNDIEPSFA